MKPNNAGNYTWLRAQTANQKLKRNAQTQGVDGMQALSALKKKQLEAMSQQIHVSYEGVASEYPAPHVSAEAPTTRHAAFHEIA